MIPAGASSRTRQRPAGHPEVAGSQQERRRIRLALLDVVRRDQDRGNRQPGGGQPRQGEPARAARHDRPAVRRHRLDELQGALRGRHVLGVGDLALDQCLVQLGIRSSGRSGCDHPQYLAAGNAVQVADEVFPVPPQHRRDAPPVAHHARRGIDQCAVEVEQDGISEHLRHSSESMSPVTDEASTADEAGSGDARAAGECAGRGPQPPDGDQRERHAESEVHREPGRPRRRQGVSRLLPGALRSLEGLLGREALVDDRLGPEPQPAHPVPDGGQRVTDPEGAGQPDGRRGVGDHDERVRGEQPPRPVGAEVGALLRVGHAVARRVRITVRVQPGRTFLADLDRPRLLRQRRGHARTGSAARGPERAP